MKKLEIKGWDCIAHDPIEEWQPQYPEIVDIWCNFSIGLKGEKSSDNFLVHVVTQAALSQIKNHEYLLVIPYYENWSQVVSEVNSKISKIEGINWQGISAELSKIFRWEYEGYSG